MIQFHLPIYRLADLARRSFSSIQLPGTAVRYSETKTPKPHQQPARWPVRSSRDPRVNDPANANGPQRKHSGSINKHAGTASVRIRQRPGDGPFNSPVPGLVPSISVPHPINPGPRTLCRAQAHSSSRDKQNAQTAKCETIDLRSGWPQGS